MDILFYIFAAAIGIAATLAAIAIRAPRPARGRALAIALTALFIPVAYLQFTELLSKPKPMSFEWFERNTKQAVVLGVSLHENESIYLWLQPDGSAEPRYYVVPWNLRLAEKLQQAVDQATREDGTVILDKPFQKRSLDEWGSINLGIEPPPLPPLKQPTPPPRIFNPRGEQI